MLMQSLKKKEERYYTIKKEIHRCIYIYRYIDGYILTQKMTFDRLMLHINERMRRVMIMIKEYSSFEIGRQVKCCETKITISK